MTSYSTCLGLLYPLGHPINLDLAWDPWLTPSYHSDGNEGRWYVAGWSGQDNLKINRDRDRALCGEHEWTAPYQRVIGSELWVMYWNRDQEKGKGSERIAMVELEEVMVGEGGEWTAGTRAKIRPEDEPDDQTTDSFPCGASLLCCTEKESHAFTDDDRDPRTGQWWNPPGAPWSTLRQEWAIAHLYPESDRDLEYGKHAAGHPLIANLSTRIRSQGNWVLFHRYIRRGVTEPWSVFDVFPDERSAVRGVGHYPFPVPVDPRFELHVHTYREQADFEALETAERTRREEEHREYLRHHQASEDAFRRLLEGKDEEGRRLARKYNATITHLMRERGDLVKELEGDQEFRGLYGAVMEAERVPAKRKAVSEVLGWLWTRKRVKVEPEDNKAHTEETRP